MKIRALAGTILFALMFVLLFSVAQAGSMPLELLRAAMSTPTWSGFQPSGWVTGTQVTCSVVVDNHDGLVAMGTYRLSTNGGVTWTGELTQGLTVSLDESNTRATLTVPNLPFAESATPNQNQIRFSILDTLAFKHWSSDYPVRIDNTPPSSTVNTAGCYNSSWSGTITGTASDAGSGVSLVDITLRRQSDGKYYNGTSWQQTPVWLAAAGTTSWSYVITPQDGIYTVQSRATDGLGHQQTTYGQSSFSYDPVPPQSSVMTAGCFTQSNWPNAIVGSASDARSGVASVKISIQRASDSLYYNGTSWSPTVTWLSVTGTTSWTRPFAPTVETRYTVRSRATDNCGNVQSALGESSFTYDATPPQSTVATSGYYNAASWPGAITGSASDGQSNVASVEVTLRRASDNLYYNGSSWSAGAQWLSVSGTTSWSLSFQPVVETGYLVNSRATDSCGNVQEVYGTGTFIFSTSAPEGPSNLSVTPSGWTSVNSFTITWTNPPSPSGIVRAYYKWDTPPTSNGDQSSGSPVDGQDIESISGLNVPAEGSHRLYLWLKDALGNVSYMNHAVTASDAFKWDATPPVSSIDSISGEQGCGDWYTSDVELHLSAFDATSAVSATFWRLDGGAWQQSSQPRLSITGEGRHTVEFYSVDLADNSEEPKQLTPQVGIDSVAPATNQPNYTGTLGRNGWYISPVTVNLNAFDATSGVSVTYHQVDGGAWEPGSLFQVATDGTRTIRYYSVDAACNEEAVQVATMPLKIDRSPPATSAETDGITRNGWFVASPVTVTLQATDLVTGTETSGVDTIRYRVDSGSWQQHSGTEVSFTVSLPQGRTEWMHAIQYYATDLAGNDEPMRTLSVGVDVQAPGPLRVLPIVLPSGWTQTNCFTLTWSPSDNPEDLSGIGGAYYSFSEPSSATDGTLVLEEGITTVPCVEIPTELGDGAHNLYIWLQDEAGNSDHRTRRVVTLRLDRTPPTLTPEVTGSRCDTSDWYNSCVTVTFAAADVHSGMATGVISYQVNGGSWVESGSWLECDDGVYSLNCRAQDSAGNVGSLVTVPLIKLDRTAPDAPMNVQVTPPGWSNDDVFTISWRNPGELSGRAGVFYKQGSPPLSATDGTYIAGDRQSLQVTASTEGQTAVYIWLQDKACNSDHQSRTVAMLKYDSTPPTTTASISGTVGGDSWYVSPARITLDVEDSASGWESSHYRIGAGPWLGGTSFLIDSSGVFTFSYYSVDAAGNIENEQAGSVKVDLDPPDSYAYADSHSVTCSFPVYWEGLDALSGIASFDVQYKVGPNGSWGDWQLGMDPSQTSKLFTCTAPGKVYYFRSRATDVAGNVEPYPDVADVYVAVDVVQNGDFERALSSEWRTTWIPGTPGQTDQCLPARGIVPAAPGGNTYAVVLGCPDEDGRQEGEVPFGTSRACQTIDVPRSDDWPAPMLAFRYRVITYDVLWSPLYGWVDSFSAGLGALGMEPTSVFTDGNKTTTYNVQIDLGWRDGALDLKPYAGRTIEVCFDNVTRVDTFYNTWTYLDDVRLMNLEHQVYLPALKRNAPVTTVSTVVKGLAAPSFDKGER